MDSNLISEWRKAIKALTDAVGKEFAEIRACKAEVEKIRCQIYDTMNTSTHYIYDPNRIVISAPEIVIGNVDRAGMLKGASTITMRGNVLRLEGVGPGGVIENTANSIVNIAEDRGPDGTEAVVHTDASFVAQARTVALDSNNSKGIYTRTPRTLVSPGLSLHSDSHLVADASMGNEILKQELTDFASYNDKIVSTTKPDIVQCSAKLEKLLAEMELVIKASEPLLVDETAAFSANFELQDLSGKLHNQAVGFFSLVTELEEMVSKAAEASRAKKAADTMKSELQTDYKESLTGSSVCINGEQVAITTLDGDGNLRENEGAGVFVEGNVIDLVSMNYKQTLNKTGSINLRAENINLLTNTHSEDEQSKDFPVEGSVNINSKAVNITTHDYEYTEEDPKKYKALPEDAAVTIMTNKMTVSTIKEDGTATGQVAINSEKVKVKTMDVDAEKKTDKQASANGEIMMVAPNILIGSKDSGIETKVAQVVSQEIGFFADKTITLAQDDGKGAVQLSGGNAEIAGGKVDIFGDTTLNGKTKLGGDTEAGKFKAGDIEASSHIKSPNIEDGIAVPAPPSTAKFSAKVKAQDVKKEA